MSEAKIGFELQKIQVPLADLLPLRQLKEPSKITRYQAILVSLKEVGLIEPLMVHPQKDAPGKYLVLDGNLRWFALKELGHPAAAAPGQRGAPARDCGTDGGCRQLHQQPC